MIGTKNAFTHAQKLISWMQSFLAPKTANFFYTTVHLLHDQEILKSPTNYFSLRNRIDFDSLCCHLESDMSVVSC